MPRRIVYIQYTNPAGYPPLEHSSRILAAAGWRVLFLGTGALGADPLTFPELPNIEVRRMPFCPAGWRQKLHYLTFCLWVVAVTIAWHPSWVYASDSLSCPVVVLLSCIPGLRILYHEHDSPTDGADGSWFVRLVRWARRLVAQRADLCVLPNRNRLQRFQIQL